MLRELARWWSEINEGQFEGAMRPPSLLVDATSRRMGCWERQARTLHLSARLIEQHPWREVIEVLRVSLTEALDWVWRGELIDAKSALALLHAARHVGQLR